SEPGASARSLGLPQCGAVDVDGGEVESLVIGAPRQEDVTEVLRRQVPSGFDELERLDDQRQLQIGGVEGIEVGRDLLRTPVEVVGGLGAAGEGEGTDERSGEGGEESAVAHASVLRSRRLR